MRYKESKMEARLIKRYVNDEIDLGAYAVVLRKDFWKIAFASLAIGLITLVGMFQLPNKYKATAVIAPIIGETKQFPAIGALALSGIDIGGPSDEVKLETLFKSNDLTARVFRNHSLWHIVFGDRYNTKTGTLKPTWLDLLLRREEGPRQPGDWDAIRAAENSLRVATNYKLGVVKISFESRSAEGSADIVQYYLQEGKSRLQEEALDRAVKNKSFIQKQIGGTLDALARDRLYVLFGQEVEREMMARNREQFGFRVIDAPRVPDRKFRPRRGLSAIAATMLTFLFGCAFSLFRSKPGENDLVAEAEIPVDTPSQTN